MARKRTPLWFDPYSGRGMRYHGCGAFQHMTIEQLEIVQKELTDEFELREKMRAMSLTNTSREAK